MKILALVLVFITKCISRILMYLYKPLFKKSGKNNVFSPYDFFSFNSISLGDDVFIGQGAKFSSITSIVIGNKVMFGPNVTIMGGDHNTSKLGEFMFDVEEKLPENDQPIVIEDDVWVGANCIILKGVVIGKGSIIGAGSLVTKCIPPNSVAVGCPAKVVKKRFSEMQYFQHLQLLERKNK